MPVCVYYITKKMIRCVYLLAVKSHPGLNFYIMSVKPKKLPERVRFTTDVDSGRCADFSCHVTDTEDLAKKRRLFAWRSSLGSGVF